MKKLCLFFCILFLLLTGILAQDNTPVGDWAQDRIGNSDYYLEIDDSTIKYVDRKTEDYMIWHYTTKGDYIYFGNIVSPPTGDFFPDLYNNKKIQFTRTGDKMIFYLADDKVKFITKESKDSKFKIATAIGGAALGLGALLLSNEMTDTVATESEVNSLADKVYKAAW